MKTHFRNVAFAVAVATLIATVFAPNDDAFAKLPAGTVESLLEPENKDKLTAILTYHVVSGKIMSADVKPGKVTTLQGQPLVISSEGSAKVGGATILNADIQASNGVIHVIDRVLIPEMPEPSPTQEAMRVIELAIKRGVPIYNNGSPEGCAAIYEVAAVSLLAGHRDVLSDADVQRLEKTLQGLSDHSASNQAWTLRGTLDSVYASLRDRD